MAVIKIQTPARAGSSVIIGFEFFISLRDRLIDIFVEFHSLEFRVCAHVAMFLPQ